MKVDKEVTGTLLKEVNSKFAILQLSNGSKALLGHNRVWLNDKVILTRNNLTFLRVAAIEII